MAEKGRTLKTRETAAGNNSLLGRAGRAVAKALKNRTISECIVPLAFVGLVAQASITCRHGGQQSTTDISTLPTEAGNSKEDANGLPGTKSCPGNSRR